LFTGKQKKWQTKYD